MRRQPWWTSLLLVAGLLVFWWLMQPPAPAPQHAPMPVPEAGRDQPPPDRTPTARTPSTSPPPDSPPNSLPPEAHTTIARIQRGGPHPYRQDGTVFQNREGHLPRKPRGHYREFTVNTPGLRHRGARRIVTGGDPPEAWYYTDDHYASFRRIEVTP